MLAKVDLICVQQDLTRSQVFRRSLMEYLKSQNAIGADVNQPEPQRTWPTELFERQRLECNAINKEKKNMGINHTIQSDL
jgi:hypothetical protein